MKNDLRMEVAKKLNAVAAIIKECAIKAYLSHDQALIQEATLAAITHETLCERLEQNGYTEDTIALINDFGNAVSQLYSNLVELDEAAKAINEQSNTTTSDRKPLLN